jgi:dihydroorotase
MMNRRRFLYTAAAGAATLSRVPNALAGPAPHYDLIVKGGRVIDPSLGVDAVRDVAVLGGRIAAVEENITAEAGDTIDARGKLVVPGLVDIHTHAARAKDGPPLALLDGVTSYIDAGSFGADNIEQGAAVVRSGPNLGYLLINIARTGITEHGELHDLSKADVAAARGAIARNRDVVAGIKARLSENVADVNDLEALRRAQEAAAPFGLPVMIHIGQSYSPLRAILPLLKRGDIVTHVYAPAPNGILDDNGRIFPDVLAARRRGVLFDFGNGRLDHFNWDVVERSLKQGFAPDTFSTDWNTQSRTTGVVDFPNVISKFLMFGMPLDQAIARATVNAAKAFDVFGDRGTLNIGAPADIAVLELREGSFEFVDNYKGVRSGRQRLFPVAAVAGGKKAPARA